MTIFSIIIMQQLLTILDAIVMEDYHAAPVLLHLAAVLGDYLGRLRRYVPTAVPGRLPASTRVRIHDLGLRTPPG